MQGMECKARERELVSCLLAYLHSSALTTEQAAAGFTRLLIAAEVPPPLACSYACPGPHCPVLVPLHGAPAQSQGTWQASVVFVARRLAQSAAC